jgi:hypothetical protein
MLVRVIKVGEASALDQAGKLVKAVVLSYMVGDQGPFTLNTTQADLLSGVAKTQMEQFAATLALLPGLGG